MSTISSFSLAYFYFQIATSKFHSQKDNHVFLTFVITKLGTFSIGKKNHVYPAQEEFISTGRVDVL